MNDLIKTATAFLLNEDAPKKQTIVEAETPNPDLFVWTKQNKKDNYKHFLQANANRVGKPMLDGGLRADDKEAEKHNGQPVEGVIYCGEGCVLYKDRSGSLTFGKLPTGLINTNDGSMQWSKYRSYNDHSSNGDARIVTNNALQFKEFAKAFVVAAKNVSKAGLTEDVAPALTEAKMKVAKDIKKGDSFKANLKIPGKGVDISKAYTVIATDDAMDSKTHPGKLVNIRVKAGNYTTVVPFEKNQKVDLVEESIAEALKTPTYPLVRKVMTAAEDLDEDELEELFFTLSNYMIYGGFGGMGYSDRLHDEVGAHLFRAAETWKERYN